MEFLTDLKTLLGIPSFLGGLYGFYLWLSSVVFRPKLMIEAPPESTVSDRRDPKTGSDAWWIHLVVSNSSRAGVKNCRAHLQQVRNLDSKLKTEPYLQSPIPLAWENFDRGDALSIGRNESARIDIGHVNATAIVLLHDNDRRPIKMLQGPGTYLLEVKVLAENAESRTVKAMLEFTPFRRPKITITE
jgi:hypothetical protein